MSDSLVDFEGGLAAGFDQPFYDKSKKWCGKQGNLLDALRTIKNQPPNVTLWCMSSFGATTLFISLEARFSQER
jgi:hypothetical protein